MSAETPVTKRTIVTDSGSTRTPTGMCKRSTENQVNHVSVYERAPGAFSNKETRTPTETTNEAETAAVAIHPAIGLPIFFPAVSKITKPARGKAGIKKEAWSTVVRQPFNTLASSAVAS